jgi:hypothetical protein
MWRIAFVCLALLSPLSAWAAPTSAELRIPLVRERTGHVSVSLNLNGIPARLLVDTGANVSTLDEALGRRFGAAFAVEPNAPEGTPAHVDLGVSLKDSAIGTETFTVLDLSFINIGTKHTGGAPFDGQLGASFFRTFNAVIDFEHMELRIRVPAWSAK